MRHTALLRLVAVAAGAVSLLAAAAGAAAAKIPDPPRAARAPGNGWSVSQTLGPYKGDSGIMLSASGASNAWSTGYYPGGLVEHWNGSGWSQVAVPSSLRKLAVNSITMGTSSSSDVWLFDHAKALRWDGTAWSEQSIPSWVIAFSRAGFYYGSAVNFSPADVWVFSRYAGHYDGKTWSKMTLPYPAVDSFSAVSASDIWALAQTGTSATNPSYVIEHWNGTAWSTVAVPAVAAPKGTSEYVGGIAADDAGSVWLTRNSEKGSAGAQTNYLEHWDGTAWAKVSFGFPTSFVSGIAQDGAGGVWMMANGPKPSYPWHYYHLSSAGQWAEDTPPTPSGLPLQQVVGLTWVPGTQSMWSTIEMDGPGNKIDAGTLWYNP